MRMQLYNVTSRVVDLVWARSPEEAMRALASKLNEQGIEVMPDGDGEDVSVSAFISEPVPEMGWDG